MSCNPVRVLMLCGRLLSAQHQLQLNVFKLLRLPKLSGNFCICLQLSKSRCVRLVRLPKLFGKHCICPQHDMYKRCKLLRPLKPFGS